MVPWHPPCALISLIFSSLDPETNCCYFEDEGSGSLSLPSYLLLRIATGLHVSFILCAVVKVQIHSIEWEWVAVDSNHRPLAYQASALTD